MRILVLGGDGMLGHQLLKHFSREHDTRVTVRRELHAYAQWALFHRSNTFDSVDACAFEGILRVTDHFRPDAIINAVGIVKQRAESKDAIPSLEVNALLPHRLAVLCRGRGIRLVHMSTDCVFSGRTGNYRETDFPDADDLYGRSKLLGEVSTAPCITLRTSIIGRELTRKVGLLEWFLSQQGALKGYREVIFSGLTTVEMARVIERVLISFPECCGLYHVSGTAISKYDLLNLINTKLNLRKTIVPDDEIVCNRSLDSTLFRQDFGYAPPSWDSMTEELVAS